jgi:hypothetical protein
MGKRMGVIQVFQRLGRLQYAQLQDFHKAANVSPPIQGRVSPRLRKKPMRFLQM